MKALLAPLISFDVKTPVQAFTDTLPTTLKDAILGHHVMVGMSTDMVLFAKGQPETKSREMDGQMPFEEWIYGKPPKKWICPHQRQPRDPSGNRQSGRKAVIFTDDVVSGLCAPMGPRPSSQQTTRTSTRWATYSATRTSRKQPRPQPPQNRRNDSRTVRNANSIRQRRRHASGAVPEAEPDDQPQAKVAARRQPGQRSRFPARICAGVHGFRNP